MSWIKTLTEALNQSLKSKLDKKEATETFAKKTDLFSRDYADLKNKPRYAEVATTGSYNDLVDKIPYATVGASTWENDLSYYDNLSHTTPINKQLKTVVIKEEDSFFGYVSAYYSLFLDDYGRAILVKKKSSGFDHSGFLSSDTTYIKSPDGHAISYYGFNIINGKLYIYEGYPNYGLFVADLNNRYSDDDAWKVDAEYISLPDSLYRKKYGTVQKVTASVEYCDGYYYVHLDKESNTTYAKGDVTVYRTQDFVTYETTPIKVGDPIRGYPARRIIKMWGDKLVVMPDRSVEPFYVLDSVNNEWIEIPNMDNDPSHSSSINYSLYNETLDMVTVFFGNSAFVCDASKLLDVDDFSWTKLKQPIERNFETGISYIDHIIPDIYNKLDRPVSVIGTYYGYYYSYDGYTWHAVVLANYHSVCFVNVYEGQFLIYAYRYNYENIRHILLSSGISIANTEYDGYRDVTSELAMAVRNKIGFVEPPPFDGTYNLKCTVVDGVPTYTWEEVTEYETLEGGDY